MAAACLTVEWCVIEKTTAETTRMKQDCAVNTSVLQNFKYIKFTLLYSQNIHCILKFNHDHGFQKLIVKIPVYAEVTYLLCFHRNFGELHF